MKKLLSLVLALTLASGLALPAAAAEESADAALARVTQAVKDTLALDTTGYDQFQGDRYEDGLTGVWSLRWDGAEGSLSVDALDDGTVTGYYLGESDTSPSSGFPTFPQGDAGAASQAAHAFLDRVLTEGESAELGEPRGMDSLGGDSFRFSGQLLLNGLPSPLHYSVTVRASDNAVTAFSRDTAAGTFLGDVPAPGAAVSQSQAAGLLTANLALRLEYVREEGSSAAVLRWVPEDTDTLYIDAATGETLNMTELEELMAGMGNGGGSDATTESPAAGAESGLTQAEQEGIAKLEGVRSVQALDQALRAQAAYGLRDYALASADYALTGEGEEEQVLCTLSYRLADGEQTRSRTVTVDARTGAVESVSSSAPWLEEGESPALTVSEAQARAEACLAEFCGARWSALTLYDSPDGGESRLPYAAFTYVQQANGIPFPENRYTIAIDLGDGSVYRLRAVYDEAVTFASPEGIVDEASALAAWADTYDTALAYQLVPRPLDGGEPLEARLLELGLTHFYGLRLTYALERDTYCLGIDAATGEPVWPETADGALTYTDLEDSWARADVEKLASYGVGYDGGLFRPDKSLTQWELVALLASLDGWRIDPDNADAETVDGAYAAAYRMGALTRSERDEDSPVTRGALVRCLLDCAGYGPAARLEGIYTCTYVDAASIPVDELGYAALAQGLGMVGESYSGARTATRGELAAMLCRLLER